MSPPPTNRLFRITVSGTFIVRTGRTLWKVRISRTISISLQSAFLTAVLKENVDPTPVRPLISAQQFLPETAEGGLDHGRENTTSFR